MSLHQLHVNKNNFTFKKSKTNTLPVTCDTVIRNLISNPKRHLGLINKKNTIDLFDKSTHKTRKIKKMSNHLTKDFSVDIHQITQVWRPSQLTDFLNKIDKQSVSVDGHYIMQPIISEAVSPDQKFGWTLVSGQQRITSIYMTLKYLETNKLRLNTCTSSADLLNKYFLNTINYEDWDNFLQNTQGSNSFINDNLNRVYQTLHNWFSKKTAVEQEIWKRKLLNHTKFIWYVAEEEPFESEKVSKTDGVVINAKYLS